MLDQKAVIIPITCSADNSSQALNIYEDKVAGNLDSLMVMTTKEYPYMLNKYDAALFDMDGILSDSKPVIELAWTTVAAKYSVTISSYDLEQHVHGRSGEYTLSYLFGHFTETEQKRIKE